MKEIGIITYYDAINVGAFLQAYCLKEFLKNRFDANVSFVQNSNVNIFGKQQKELLNCKNPFTFVHNFKRCRTIKKAQKEHLPVGTAAKHYDFAVVGSDEMWNFSNAVFSGYNFGEGVKCQKILTYAISMGNFSAAIPEKYRSKVNAFAGLSVRDTNSMRVLQHVVHDEIDIHIDPVFLIDIPSQKRKRKFGKYILVYNAFQKKVAAEIQDMARRRGLVTVSVDILNPWCDHCIASESPFDTVGLIDGAELVVTNMFHGTMLSIARHKAFISLLTERRKMKIEYAAGLFGVAGRCIDLQKHSEHLCTAMEAALEDGMDHNVINATIDAQRAKTFEYFSRCFSKGGEKH